uniref:MICOS complex subunit n=1 Tax=Hydatigena taeniaeformis TaxID=6205 RepID=A0A0R3WN94_HYDTA
LPIYNSLIDENKEYVLEAKPDSRRRRKNPLDFWLKVQWVLYNFVFTFVTAIGKRVREDPVVLARAGFIMVCGLGGLVLGSRGFLRQITYGCLGAGVGTVMCYPSGSLKAMDYAWNSTTSKLIETSEVEDESCTLVDYQAISQMA